MYSQSFSYFRYLVMKFMIYLSERVILDCIIQLNANADQGVKTLYQFSFSVC